MRIKSVINFNRFGTHFNTSIVQRLATVTGTRNNRRTSYFSCLVIQQLQLSVVTRKFELRKNKIGINN